MLLLSVLSWRVSRAIIITTMCLQTETVLRKKQVENTTIIVTAMCPKMEMVLRRTQEQDAVINTAMYL